MKTVTINGIEFTDRVPTEAGDYNWAMSPESEVCFTRLMDSGMGLRMHSGGGPLPESINAFWSRLLPASTIAAREEAAFREGHKAGTRCQTIVGQARIEENDWLASATRRLGEGKP